MQYLRIIRMKGQTLDGPSRQNYEERVCCFATYPVQHLVLLQPRHGVGHVADEARQGHRRGGRASLAFRGQKTLEVAEGTQLEGKHWGLRCNTGQHAM